jgi:hypothetical protein
VPHMEVLGYDGGIQTGWSDVDMSYGYVAPVEIGSLTERTVEIGLPCPTITGS